MLIGQKKDFFVALKGPLECAPAIRGRADHATTLAAERFDCGSGVHVSQWRDAVAFVVGQTEINELLPRIFNLGNLSHIGHRTPGVQVWEYNRLSVARQHVSAFGHEVYTAEHNVAAVSFGSHLRKAVRVAATVGKTNHLIALVMMPEDHALFAQNFFGFANAVVHRMVGEYEIVFERAGCCFRYRCCCHVDVSAFSPGREVPVLRVPRPGTGMLKALPAAPVDPLTVTGPDLRGC